MSASAAMTRKVRELRAQGVKIVGLSSGEPDFPTPPHAIEAAHKAALAGDTKYPPQDGVRPLKEAIQRKFKRDNNLDYAIEEILVTNGSKQIMYDAVMASVNPGDEVIIPAPAGSAMPTRRARRCHAGVGVVPGEQPVQAARRRSRGRDHAADEMGGPQLSQQSDGCGVLARRDEGTRPGPAATRMC